MIRTGSKSRLKWIDVAKGIAILAILVHHLGFTNATGAPITPYLQYFHVPLFFFASGFFISTRLPFKEWLRRRALRLLGPYVVTCVAIGIAVLACKVATGSAKPPTSFMGLKQFAWSALYGSAIRRDAMPGDATLIGAIWFLEALFVGSVEVRLVISRFSKCPIIGAAIVGLVAYAAFAWARVCYMPFNIQTGLFSGLVIYSGYLYRWHDGLDRRLDMVTASILVFIYLWSCREITEPFLGGPFLSGGLISLVSSFCACRLVLEVARLISERIPSLSRLLEFFGRNSLVVLCVHLFLLDMGFRSVWVAVLGPIMPNMSQNGLATVDLMLHLLLCVSMIACFKKTRFLRKVFF